MAKRAPRSPRMAWEKNKSPQESNSAPQPEEAAVVEPLKIDISWFPLYAKLKKTIDFICKFVSCPEKEHSRKMNFLDSVRTVCQTAKKSCLLRGLDMFYRGYKVVEKVQALLQEECGNDYIHLELWQKAMCVVTELSSVERVLEGKEKFLIQTCLTTLLPLSIKAKEFFEAEADTDPCTATLEALDRMMEELLGIIPVARVSEELQNIFQTLLDFTSSGRAAVRQRALGRIKKLSRLLANNPTLQVWEKRTRPTKSPVFFGDLPVPNLGQLLGRLFVFPHCVEENGTPDLDALCSLYEFIRKQESRSMPTDGGHLQKDTEDTSVTDFLDAKGILMRLARYLRSEEKTDIVIAAIEAMNWWSVSDKDAARNVVDVAMGTPECWLLDNPGHEPPSPRTPLAAAAAEQTSRASLLLKEEILC
ncbi:uncharacterized protein LOC128850458 [Cuculus canorus]|uniref:uncharacterized protein LOC128850458 n=1 Tax=Cuculus canorus TaxID=55661 RepID=UPI0023AAEA44|nr:uncharacterized protein LOC128850458 [Cuculus canorus]